MKRKLVALIILCLIVVAGLLTFTFSRSSVSNPITFAEAQQQASSQKNLPTCFELQSQNTPVGSGEDITKVVSAKVTEVPAGVANAVFFKSYNEQVATGTIEYDGVNNNTFNFAVEKTNNTQNKDSSWKLTSFTACSDKS